MYITIQGLVLRITQYNDTDALLSVLTKGNGKLTIKARGLRRKNSNLAAACQLLSYSEFTLFEYRGMYTINEAHCIELFQGLRKDLQKLSLGTYFAQVAEAVSQEDTPSGEHLSLLLNCLYTLAKTNVDERLVKAVFELRCACVAGYMPDLSGCWSCGSSAPEMFDLTNARTECRRCLTLSAGNIRLPITPGVLDAMRYICTCDSKKIFSFELGADALKLLSDVSEGYLSTQLERGFTCLDYYKTLSFSREFNI